MEQNKTIGANGIKAIGAFAKRVAKEAATSVKEDIRQLLAADYYNVEESDDAYAPISSAINIYTGTFETFYGDGTSISNSLSVGTIDEFTPGDRITLLNATDTLNITMIGKREGIARFMGELYIARFLNGPTGPGKPKSCTLHCHKITTSKDTIETFTDEEIEELLEEALTEVEAETQTLAMDEDVPEISNEEASEQSDME